VTDEEFMRAFETATFPAARFDHAAHVRAGWWYVTHYTLGEAIDRFSHSLRAFAAANNVSGKYHETMTVAWMLLIAERVGVDRDGAWEVFAARYPELFATPSLVSRYYSDAVLASERARQHFMMPDLGGR